MLVSLMEKFVEDVRICAVWQIYNDLISDLTTFTCLQKKKKKSRSCKSLFLRDSTSRHYSKPCLDGLI